MGGDMVKCWKANHLPVAPQYNCPLSAFNPDCVKIFSPEDELRRRRKKEMPRLGLELSALSSLAAVVVASLVVPTGPLALTGTDQSFTTYRTSRIRPRAQEA